MTTTKIVERLLKKGLSRKKLVEEYGFSKATVTSAVRRLKEAEAARGAASKSQHEGTAVQPRAGSASSAAMDVKKLAELEAAIGGITGRVGDIEQRIDGTPLVGCKQAFKCECGESGYLAVSVKCTKCGREAWWGWWPKTE